MTEREIYRESTRSADLTFTGGEIKIKECDVSSGIGVRTLDEKRLGFAFCQSEEGLAEALEHAKKTARFSVRSGFSFPGKKAFKMPVLFDKGVDPDDLSWLHSMVRELRDVASYKGGRPRVICHADVSEVSLENSSGFEGSYQESGVSVFVECMHGDGYGMSFFTSHSRPKDIAIEGIKAAEMAEATQSAGKPEAGKHTVVMEVEALENLIDTLLPSFSGDWKRRKITKAEEGKMMFSEKFSLYDDGLAPGSGAQPFDDEGTPSERRALIENGQVRSFLYDRETAALEGVERSGACSRDGYDSPPGIGSSNLVVGPGEWNDLGELGSHIEVHYAHGSHTANPTTGDIGLEVSAAFIVEKGEKKPVKGFMLSGNVFEWLNRIAGIEKRQKVFGSFIAPRMAFSEVQVVV
ncbi:MAG: TldD/PmbA family protein [Candidatus Micrarchaeota archaeon]